jgi:predicted transcriptional regulator
MEQITMKAHTSISLPIELIAKIKELAERNRRSFSAELTAILEANPEVRREIARLRAAMRAPDTEEIQ